MKSVLFNRKVRVIAEATYDIEAQFLDAGNEALLGEVGVSHNEITGVFFPALGMKQGSMPIAIRFPTIGERKWRLNESQSKGFLKFWRNRLSHERPHLAIWVKFMVRRM